MGAVRESVGACQVSQFIKPEFEVAMVADDGTPARYRRSTTMNIAAGQRNLD